MKAATIAVHWHDDNHPIYSVDLQPSSRSRAPRLATAGGDNNVRLWRVQYPQNGGEIGIEYLSTLRKHTQAVNVVRFDASGKMLASGGDDGLLIVWELADKIVTEFGHQDDEVQESWVAKHVHSTQSEIYDLSWAPDSSHIATGSMDNAVKVYSVQAGSVGEMACHSHYVQGVAWDPLNEYLAAQSADRAVSVFSVGGGTPVLVGKTSRAELPMQKIRGQALLKKSAPLYHSETLQSFFRRLAFSPDGSMLITPSGVYRSHDKAGASETPGLSEKADDDADTRSLNTVYVYIRAGLGRAPVCHLPGFTKPAIAIAFNPNKYAVSGAGVFSLPYKMVFAVATQDCVVVYDTQHLQPVCMVSNLHYLTITDLCWEHDGLSILVSSAEGFCSAIMFESGAFGEIQESNTADAVTRSCENNCITPIPTSIESPAENTSEATKPVVPTIVNLTPRADSSKTAYSDQTSKTEFSNADQTSKAEFFNADQTSKTEFFNADETSAQTPKTDATHAVSAPESKPPIALNAENGVTQSLLDQFTAKAVPTELEAQPKSPEKRTSENDKPAAPEAKKKRIAPTLVEKRE